MRQATRTASVCGHPVDSRSGRLPKFCSAECKRSRKSQAQSVKRSLAKTFEPQLIRQQQNPGTFSAAGNALIAALAGAAESGITVDNPASGLNTARGHEGKAVNWASKGAYLDVDEIRRIDRERFGGIVAESSFSNDDSDGWIPVDEVFPDDGEAWTNGVGDQPGQSLGLDPVPVPVKRHTFKPWSPCPASPGMPFPAVLRGTGGTFRQAARNSRTGLPWGSPSVQEINSWAKQWRT